MDWFVCCPPNQMAALVLHRQALMGLEKYIRLFVFSI